MITGIRDFAKLIPSEDIRLYHAELFPAGYEYSAQEAAYLVYQSKTLSMGEKHEAWHWIINHMPDEVVQPLSPNYPAHPSFHQALKLFMDEQKYGRWMTDIKYQTLFDGMCFNFPLPFKKYDIVCCLECPHEPMLLEDAVPWLLQKDPKDRPRYLDSSDMHAICSQIIGGYLQRDIRPSILEIESYVKALAGEQRILGLLSLFEMKRISVHELLQGYRLILVEDEVQKTKDSLERLSWLSHTEYAQLLEEGFIDL